MGKLKLLDSHLQDNTFDFYLEEKGKFT